MKKISTTQLAKKLSISKQKLDLLLLECNYIETYQDKYILTSAGISNGGSVNESRRFGQYISWDENMIIPNIDNIKKNTTQKKQKDDFRTKFIAKLRTNDGHFVRSKAEILIDNWLYNENIVHTYEKKLPIEEELYCDFYIPTKKIYIEFWGLENKPEYIKRRTIKQDIYKKYNFNLIELNDNDIFNLDDILPKQLLKHGLKTY